MTFCPHDCLELYDRSVEAAADDSSREAVS
ncbi:MAG: hypothetical protein AAGU11_02800 [Syntrophobacteraceae bacterium]